MTPYPHHAPLTQEEKAEVGKSIVDMLREQHESKLVQDKLEIAEEKLRLHEALNEAESRTAPAWWADWIKPGPALLLLGMLGGGFQLYQSDKTIMMQRYQEQANAMLSLAAEVHSNAAETKARTEKYIPVIERLSATLDRQDEISKQQAERINNMAQTLMEQRQLIETLRTVINATHEELMIEKARRDKSAGMGPQKDAFIPAEVK